MSTMLQEGAGEWWVSTVSGHGKRRKLARGKRLVPKGDEAMLIAEIVRQAKAARVAAGIKQQEEVPVVLKTTG